MCHPLHRLCFKGIRGRAEAGLAVGREGRNHTDAFPLHLPAGKTMLAILSVLMSLSALQTVQAYKLQQGAGQICTGLQA